MKEYEMLKMLINIGVPVYVITMAGLAILYKKMGKKYWKIAAGLSILFGSVFAAISLISFVFKELDNHELKLQIEPEKLQGWHAFDKTGNPIEVKITAAKGDSIETKTIEKKDVEKFMSQELTIFQDPNDKRYYWVINQHGTQIGRISNAMLAKKGFVFGGNLMVDSLLEKIWDSQKIKIGKSNVLHDTHAGGLTITLINATQDGKYEIKIVSNHNYSFNYQKYKLRNREIKSIPLDSKGNTMYIAIIRAVPPNHPDYINNDHGWVKVAVWFTANKK